MRYHVESVYIYGPSVTEGLVATLLMNMHDLSKGIRLSVATMRATYQV